MSNTSCYRFTSVVNLIHVNVYFYFQTLHVNKLVKLWNYAWFQIARIWLLELDSCLITQCRKCTLVLSVFYVFSKCRCLKILMHINLTKQGVAISGEFLQKIGEKSVCFWKGNGAVFLKSRGIFFRIL